MKQSKLFLLLCAIALLSGCTPSLRHTTVPRSLSMLRCRIDSLLSTPQFRQTIVAIRVYSIDNDENLYTRNNKLLLHPASTLKLFTAGAALEALGDTFQFQTIAYVDSQESYASVLSRLYLKGFGDPLLMPDDLDSIARQVAANGVTRITESLIVDDSFFDSLYWGNGWMWDDAGDPDAPYISALSINNNTINLVILPSLIPESSAIISESPATSLYHCVNRTKCVLDSVTPRISISWLSFPDNLSYSVDGALQTTSPALNRTIAIPHPEIFTGNLLRRSLLSHQIDVPLIVKRGYVPANAKPIAWHTTPCDSVIAILLKNSNNLAAENLVKFIAAYKTGIQGNTKNGIYFINRYLASVGVDTTNLRIVDGSGVSRYNLLSADALVNFLVGIKKYKPYWKVFNALLPLGGEGTLKNRFCTLPVNLRAKTGTLNGVSNIAGYVYTADGELLAFAILMQHFTDTSVKFRAIQDSILIELSKFTRQPEY